MILVFDTSSSHLAIGIADDAGVITGEFHADAADAQRGIHDARLAIETERLLERGSIRPKEVNRIGLIIGPGSFTGLRIGLSFAKGFAFAVSAALVPLTQHEVIAIEIEEQSGSLIVTPGYREDLFYVADFSNPRHVRIMDADALLAQRKRPIVWHNSFKNNLPDFISLDGNFAAVSLSTMARLTASCGDPLSEFGDLEPLYLT